MTKRAQNKTPKQITFLAKYHDPKSDTYGNAFRSAIISGFSTEYARNVTAQMPKWLSETLEDSKMLRKAERNIDSFLDLETKEPVITTTGILIDKNTDEVITKENSNLLRIKADTSKFVAEKIGRKKWGQQGPSIAVQVNVQQDRDKFATTY